MRILNERFRISPPPIENDVGSGNLFKPRIFIADDPFCAESLKNDTSSGEAVAKGLEPAWQARPECVPYNRRQHPRERGDHASMRLAQIKTVPMRMVDDIVANNLFIMAAGLSYYFIISLFPGLIFFSAIVSFLPISDVTSRTFLVLTGFIPPVEMKIISTVLHEAVVPNRGALLSIGAIGVLWAASSAFDSLMTAIGIAYGAPDTRPFWITRPIAIGLTISIGVLFLIAFVVLTVGPHFGSWLALRLGLSYPIDLIWPYIRWLVAVAFAIVSVEVLYFIAPRKKQHFLATLPGAILAVGCWLLITYSLGAYYRGHSPRGAMYGSLANGILFMIWLYWAGFIVLVGAQLNAELEKLQKPKNPHLRPMPDQRPHLSPWPTRKIIPPRRKDDTRRKGSF